MTWRMYLSTGLCSVVFGFGCANQNEVKEIDTSLEVKGSVNDNSMGIDEQDQMVLQEEVHADQELKSQIWVNNKLLEDLSHERHQLQRCRDDLADPRLGGRGLAHEVPEIDNAIAKIDQERIGLDKDGNYKVVRRQSFVERLKWERKRADGMRSMHKVIKKMRRECEQKMRFARIRHGLPPSRYEPRGHFAEDGSWVMTQKGEQSLDDAFEIAARLSAKKASNPSSQR